MLKFWQAITLWKRVLIGLGAGMVIGLMAHYGGGADFITTWVKPFGDGFVRLIKMLVIPLIATTLVSGVTAMGDPSKLGSLGAKTLACYFLTTLFAVCFGLLFGTVFQPGVGVEVLNAKQQAISMADDKIAVGQVAGDIVTRLLNIIPINPVGALASGDVLPVILFSILVGVGILFVGEKAAPVRDFFVSAAEVVMKMTLLIMELAPFGVFALMSWVLADQGLGILANMGKLAIALYLACIAHIILVYGLLIVRFILKLPVRRFFYGILDAQGVAYSTASSNATLPVSISCARDNLGVEASVAGSVLPLGATINMDGTAIYLGLVAMFAAQALGIEVNVGAYMMIALTAVLTSIGAAGIPSAGLLLAATVLSVIGVSAEQSILIIAFILPFDRLLDMMRTMTNVTGDIAVACMVAKSEKQLDEDIFKAPSLH